MSPYDLRRGGDKQTIPTSVQHKQQNKLITLSPLNVENRSKMITNNSMYVKFYADDTLLFLIKLLWGSLSKKKKK